MPEDHSGLLSSNLIHQRTDAGDLAAHQAVVGIESQRYLDPLEAATALTDQDFPADVVGCCPVRRNRYSSRYTDRRAPG